MDDLFKALQMFSQGVQQGATLQAVNEANVQMQQINQAQIDESQKRVALQNLGNELALRMTGTGANAAQVEQAFRAVTPQQFGSVEQMQLEGELSGKKQLQDVSSKILQQREQKQQRAMFLEHKLKLDEIMAKEQMMAMREAVAAGMKPKEMKAEDVAFNTNVQMAGNLSNKLAEAINRSGTWEAGNVPLISNKEDAAVLDAVPYQLAITYAKLVDPASVAREGEVNAAQKYLIDLGMTSSKSKALAQIKHMQDTIQEYAQTRGQVKGQPATQQPQEAKWESMRLSNGRVIQYQRLPDGNIRVK